MIRYLTSAAFVVLVAGGCAGAPQRPEAHAPAAAVEPATLQAQAAPSEAAAIEPDLVVDVNDLAARAAPDVVCRDMLRQGSNVIIRRCMTERAWKLFERREAQEAAQIVRMMQGNPFR